MGVTDSVVFSCSTQTVLCLKILSPPLPRCRDSLITFVWNSSGNVLHVHAHQIHTWRYRLKMVLFQFTG